MRHFSHLVFISSFNPKTLKTLINKAFLTFPLSYSTSHISFYRPYDFAIPYLEKYSVISNIINDMEGGLLINQADELHNLPIYYYLEGEKSHALNYMSHRLKSMEQKTLKDRSDESFICNVYDKQPIVDNRHYRQYKHFCESFISYMQDGHCDYGAYNKNGDSQ